MEFLANYALFILKVFTAVILVIVLPLLCLAAKSSGKDKSEGELSIKNLNKKFTDAEKTLVKSLSKQAQKAYRKKQKEKKKSKADENRPTIYVLTFEGDVNASATEALQEEITAILQVATPADEVLLLLESYGGAVHQYGLAAAQLQRLRYHKIPLTIAVDRVAASGGYLMACIANTIVAAPFAIIGSIGVIAQLPNLHRLLKHNYVDFEQLTAGQYKRTINVFAPNTKEGLQKTQSDIEAVHDLFKTCIKTHRPQVPVEKAATGEYWHAIDENVQKLKLIDKISTSHDYLYAAKDTANIYEVRYERKKKLFEKIASSLHGSLNSLGDSLSYFNQKNRFL